MSNPTKEPQGPLQKAGELYGRIIVMAEARDFTPASTEMLTALMLASSMMQSDDQIGRTRTMRRITRQAMEFIEAGIVQEVPEDEAEPPASA